MESNLPTLVSRQEAIARGLTRYYTGKSCKHGHVDERLLSNGTCVTCLAIARKSQRKVRQNGVYVGRYYRSNPGWLKVGVTDHLRDRVRAYQTCSPHRDFTVLLWIPTASRDEALILEADILSQYPNTAKNEWVPVSY